MVGLLFYCGTFSSTSFLNSRPVARASEKDLCALALSRIQKRSQNVKHITLLSSFNFSHQAMPPEDSPSSSSFVEGNNSGDKFSGFDSR